MKALSIIGIILSVAGILNSLAIMDLSCSYDSYVSDHGLGPGIVSLILSAFFLAFSITATAVSFRKKTGQ